MDRPLQRASPVHRVPASLDEQLACRFRDDQHDPAFVESLLEPCELDVHDCAQLILGQRLEHDDVVDAVQELGPEVVAQNRHDRLAHVVERPVCHFLDQLASQVGRHDQHRVAEVDRAPLTVGQAAVVEDLQQDVEDIRVGFLNLVEQHHRVRPPPHCLSQLTAFVVPNVARRRTDHSGHGVLFLVLGHVEPDERLLVVEQERGEGPCELGLTDTGRPEKDERTHRTVGVGKT